MKPGLNKGKLSKWNDDRGFGFIKPSEGSREVFLHISAVETTSRRPKNGDTIFYELVTGADGKIRASSALIQGVVSQSSTTQRVKIAPAKQNRKKRGLVDIILGIGILTIIALFQRQCSFGRSPSIITAVTKPGCTVKGNISIESGAKLYHVPGMEDYDGTIIHSGKGEKWFCSEAEAVAAGWRKAPR